MPIFKLSAPETVRLLSGHILNQKCIKFHPHPSRFQKIFPGRYPGPCLQGQGREERGWEGIKVFAPLKEVQRERTGARGMRVEKERRGQRQGGSCSKILGG